MVCSLVGHEGVLVVSELVTAEVCTYHAAVCMILKGMECWGVFIFVCFFTHGGKEFGFCYQYDVIVRYVCPPNRPREVLILHIMNMSRAKASDESGNTFLSFK